LRAIERFELSTPDADLSQAVDALVGAGYGSAGERCMAVSVAVPVGEAAAQELMTRLMPRVENLKIGPSTDEEANYGPLVTKAHLDKVRAYVDLGVKEGAKSTGATSSSRAMRTAFIWAVAYLTQ